VTIQEQASPPTEALGRSRFGVRSRFSAAASGGLVNSLGILIAIAALTVSMSLLSPYFLTRTNFINVLEQASPIGIMAVGQTILMISGGFDISVGAVYYLSGAVAGEVWNHGYPGLAFPAALLAGAVVGLGNGVIVNLLRVNPFIATFGMTLIIRSITIPLTNSSIIFVSGPGFKVLGNSTFVTLPLQLWIFLAALLLGGLVLRKTTYGRYVYAIGGNREAARLSGLPVRFVRISAFTVSGLSAGLAGLIAVSQLGIAGSQPGVGSGLEFSVIAAVVVGGTSLYGGRGAMWRTFAGVCLLAFLANGFNLLNFDYSVQQAVTGAVILVAVGLDAFSRRETRESL
jgi:ribose transport system permease protein